MQPLIEKPSDDELQGLLAAHAHRFPEKAVIHVAGDGGALAALPILLGNPSGACKMPDPNAASSAWDNLAAATFAVRESEGLPAQLASDCVLWPGPSAWATWTRRWPALPELLQVAIRRKTGAAKDMIEAPATSVPRPPALAALFERQPGAVWRRFKATDQVIDLAVAPPSFDIWRLFTSAMKARDARHAELARDLVTKSVVAAVREDGTAVDTEMLLGRYCGLALSLGLTVSHLAGLTGSIALGEW